MDGPATDCPAGESSREVPMHEAQPWGPTRPSAQIPSSCPSLADRPTSAQGYREVLEKLPRDPAHLHLRPQPGPRPTRLTPRFAQGKPGQGRPLHGPSSLPGNRIPWSPPPLPHPPENYLAFVPGSGGEGLSPTLVRLCMGTRVNSCWAYIPLSPLPTSASGFLQPRTFQTHHLQGVIMPTEVKAQLLSF